MSKTRTGPSIKIQENVLLAPYTTFKIGGPARYFCEVANEQELLEAVNFAKKKKLAAFFLGGGSNVVVSDDGFKGLVVKISSQKPQYKMMTQNGHMFLECWAGENLSHLVNMALEGSWSGLEWAAGIPGTIGGAIRGNAGAHGGCVGDIVESVEVMDLDDLKTYTYDVKKCKFDYRTSVFKEKENLVVLSSVLKLKKSASKEEIENKIKENIKKRTERFPKFPSAGSFFQNPTVSSAELKAQFERDAGTKCRDNKVPAGWLIIEAGLKGKKVGNVQISDEHGNFIINLGGGRAQDVVMLASIIKQKVRVEMNVQLVEEVRYVGF